jgi:hypothetical protein
VHTRIRQRARLFFIDRAHARLLHATPPGMRRRGGLPRASSQAMLRVRYRLSISTISATALAASCATSLNSDALAVP